MAEPTHLPGMTPRVAQHDRRVEAFVIEQMRLATRPSGHLRLETDLALMATATGALRGWMDSALDRALHDGLPMLQVRRSGSGSADVAGDIARWAAMLSHFVMPKHAIDLPTLNQQMAELGAALLDLKDAKDAGWTDVQALFEQQHPLSAVWLVDVEGVQNQLAVPAYHEALQQLVATYAAEVLAAPTQWDALRAVAVATAPLADREFAPVTEAAGWPDEGLPEAPAAPLDPLGAARARRDAILADGRWLTSDEVALEARGAVVDSNPAQYASRLRREGRLFGVRVRGQYLHPAFQFQKNGEVHPAMAKLIALLPTSEANWTAAFWLFQPTHALDGHRPVDVFPIDPRRVIEVAETEFRGDHGRW